MNFVTDILIRFHHCDPAGIVFYPRYFEMVNMVVEDFFARALGASFADMGARGEAVPTVRVECDFVQASQIGDIVTFELGVERVGNSSFAIRVRAHRDGEDRFRMRGTLVFVQLGPPYRPRPLPDAIRARMRDYLVADAPSEQSR